MVRIEQFEIIDRCLFWEKEKILVVGDLHLGYEEVLMEQGVSFPKTLVEEIFKLFKKIFQRTGRVKKIILLGDVKHFFGGVLKGESGDFFNLMELFKKNLLEGGKVVITKGNHDSILKPVTDNYDFVELVDFFVVDDVLFFHGAKNQWDKFQLDIFDEKIKLVVTGHFHPAVRISDDGKSEKYKCFAFGQYKKKKWLILPSFFPLVEGTELAWLIDERGFKKNYGVRKFKVYVLSGDFNEVLEFGK